MPFSLDSSCILINSTTYSAGDTVSGTVSFTTDKPLSARFIQVSLLGEARVQAYYTKKITESVRHLWKSTDGKNVLPAGKHVFPFSFNPLPDDSEPSFRGPNGSISYKIQVLVYRPWALLWIKKEIVVTGYKEGKELVKNEDGRRWYSKLHVPGTFFPDGNISMTIKMPKLCFTPGETARIGVLIENNSSKAIRSVGYKLLRLGHYHKKPQHVPCTVRSQCPVHFQERTDSEEILKKKKLTICVKPFSTTEVDIEVELHKDLIPIFESPMISIGYRLLVTCTTNSFTNNKARIRVPMAIRNPTDKSDKKKELPPPYSK